MKLRGDYLPQCHRPNKYKPSVARGLYGAYQARGYDRQEHFHVKSGATWAEAYATALQWAREGYPEP
jgi:hypothetical protein